jgi:hypothetical protein
LSIVMPSMLTMMSFSLTPAVSAGPPDTTAGSTGRTGRHRNEPRRRDRPGGCRRPGPAVDGDVADADPRPGELLAAKSLLHDRPRDVDRDREADPLRRPRDGGIDADDEAVRVEQGSAAVARVDRGVCLMRLLIECRPGR